MMTIKAADIAWTSSQTTITDRDFSQQGDGRYEIIYTPAGVVFQVDRLRRERHELVGELLVRVRDAAFPHAKLTEGVLSIGDFNFSSVQARSTRAKLIAERAGDKDVDWFGLLEEFCVKVIRAERQGPSPVDLRSVPEDDAKDSTETWDVNGLPILKDHPTILFGDGGGGKSYLSLYIAGTLAEEGVNVLYCDWEFSMAAHRTRFRKLFRPEPAGVFYQRCERPMREEADKLNRLIKQHRIGYVICDSVGYACDGRPEEAERANEYFRAVRSLGIGSLHLAHITKNQNGDEKPQGPIGSIFWRNGARSVWLIEAAKENPTGTLRFGLYHKKNNLGALLAPRAYTLTFADKTTTLTQAKVQDIDELAAALPVLDRMKRLLLAGPMTVKDIAEDLNISQGVVRATTSRHGSVFIKVGGKKIGVKNVGDLEF